MRIDRSLRLVLIFAGTTLLAGCMLGPEPRRPDAAEMAGWSAESARAFDRDLGSRAVREPFDGRRWWAAFHDPVLDRLVARVSAQNLDVQAAGLRIASARAQREATLGGRYPNVEGSGIAGRSRMSENGISQALAGGSAMPATPATGAASGGAGSGGGSAGAPSTFNLFQAGFDATWEIDLFGGTARSIQASDADVRAADEARRDALVSVTAEVAREWLGLRGARRQREIALADIETELSLGRLVASRNRAGLAPSSDVAAQGARVEQARAQLPAIEQRIAQGGNRLALLLALPPGGLEEITEASAGAPALPPEVPVGLPGELLQRRPDVRQREAEVAAATLRIGVARARLFPSIRLGATAGLQATSASDLLDWGSRFFIGGAQLSIPIFEGGRLRAQVKVADVEAQRTVLAYRQTVLSAFHDVDNALVAYAAAQRKSRANKQQLAEATRSRVLARSRYESGLAAFIGVLDADRQSHQAELSLAESEIEASTDLVALFKALGGGWEDEMPLASR